MRNVSRLIIFVPRNCLFLGIRTLTLEIRGKGCLVPGKTPMESHFPVNLPVEPPTAGYSLIILVCVCTFNLSVTVDIIIFYTGPLWQKTIYICIRKILQSQNFIRINLS